MKKFFLMCAILAGCMDGVWSQISVFDCQALDPTVTQQEIDATNDYYKQCIHFDAPGGYQFGLVDNNNVHAVSEISLKDGFHSGHFVGPGQMHLYLDEKKSLGVFLMNQEFDLSGVPVFGKLELGIGLDPSITSHISDFFAGTNTGTELNPFDPEDLDIEATFHWYNPNTQQWIVPQTRFGFYFEDYERDLANETWNLLPDAGQRFRVRFAPRILGKWKGSVKVKVNGVVVQESNEFVFQVVPSNNKDFVRVGQNKRYLMCGNEPFFPVGQNLAWPEPNSGMSANSYAVPSSYERYHQEIEDLATQGANYFRLLLNPISLEIEHKELGNYKNNMNKAWEIDRILERAKENSLRIHFNLQVHYPYETVSQFGFKDWDWAEGTSGFYSGQCIVPWDDGNIYKTELGLTKPSEFLTDAEARRFYKNRLRYIVSRWGYSTEIAVFELFSEINNLGVQATLQFDGGGCPSIGNAEEEYYDNPAVPGMIYQWHEEMINYMRNELKHYDHLYGVNYTGEPSIQAGDLSFYGSTDIRSYNDYTLNPERFQNAHNKIIAYNFNGGGKPFIFSEIGSGEGAGGCDLNVEYISSAICSPFTGATGAIPWDWGTLVSAQNVPIRNNLWHLLGNMAEFMDGIPLDEDNWMPYVDVRGDKKADMPYLMSFVGSSFHRKAVGVVHNRRANFYTLGDSTGNCIDLDNYFTSSGYNSIAEVQHATTFQFAQKLQLIGMGAIRHYRIKFFDPFTGAIVSNQTKWSTPTGHLHIEFPTLSSNLLGSMLLFKVFKHDGSFNAPLAPSQMETEEILALLEPLIITNAENGDLTEEIHRSAQVQPAGAEHFLSVFPNPTQEKCVISFKLESANQVNLKMVDMMGNTVFLIENVQSGEEIDVSTLNQGVYIFQITNGSELLQTKLIIQ